MKMKSWVLGSERREVPKPTDGVETRVETRSRCTPVTLSYLAPCGGEVVHPAIKKIPQKHDRTQVEAL